MLPVHRLQQCLTSFEYDLPCEAACEPNNNNTSCSEQQSEACNGLDTSRTVQVAARQVKHALLLRYNCV